jgi:hypothetical protein
MPREKALRKQLMAALAEQGASTVETRLSQGVYGEHNEALVREWLDSQISETAAPTPPVARQVLAVMRLQPVDTLRKKPGRVITWVVIGIVLLEVLGFVASAIFSSPTP